MSDMKQEDPLVAAFKLVIENGDKNDRALLELCTKIVERTNEMSDHIDSLQSRILDLYEKLDTLAAVIHTHFTNEEIH